MKGYLAFCLTATLALSGLVQSAPIDDYTWGVESVQSALDMFEGARKNDFSRISRALEFSRALDYSRTFDEKTKESIKNELPLLNTMFDALNEYADMEPGSGRSCDSFCVMKATDKYLSNRPSDLSSYKIHNHLQTTKAAKFFDALLEKPDAQPLTEQLINEAYAEYESWLEYGRSIGKGNRLLEDLFKIESATGYYYDQPGRALAIMWPHYKMKSNNYASLLRQKFYEIIHQSGYGIRDGKIVKIDVLDELQKVII